MSRGPSLIFFYGLFSWVLVNVFCSFESKKRVVLTFSNSSLAVEAALAETSPSFSVVKQYGRRLVLSLSQDTEPQALIEFYGGPHVVADVEEDLLVNTLQNSSILDSEVESQYSVLESSPSHGVEWQFAANESYGMQVERLWRLTNGSLETRITVLDSGIAPIAKEKEWFVSLEEGYDFVSDPSFALDGDGRDANAEDPGDAGGGCPVASWHGTKMAFAMAGRHGVIEGLHSVAWNTTIQPLRVLGLCSVGFANDVTDAIVWAAGGLINGLGVNPKPAHIISMAFGGRGKCPSFLQSAINMAIQQFGATVVAAAGNQGSNVQDFFPANCQGVIAVAASTARGSLAEYSNRGPLVKVAAPGGDSQDAILTLDLNTDSFSSVSVTKLWGTSFSTSFSAGFLALALGIEPGMPLKWIWDKFNVAFSGSDLSTLTECISNANCGAGILSAAKTETEELFVPTPQDNSSVSFTETEASWENQNLRVEAQTCSTTACASITHNGIASLSPTTITGSARRYFRFTATTGTNTITFDRDTMARVLVVGGGGAGGSRHGGGGGAGGMIQSPSVLFKGGTVYTMVVGAGGAAISGNGNIATVNNGVASEIKYVEASTTYTMFRAAWGGGGCSNSASQGGDGASGGGGTASSKLGGGITFNHNTPNGYFGNNGGTGINTDSPCDSSGKCWCGAGGGGASSRGTSGTQSSTGCTGGNGGNGTIDDITGSSVTYAAGGGGGASSDGIAAGAGGSSGVGGAGSKSNTAASAGAPNTGSGGGGSGFYSGTTQNGASGAGGSGVVIIQWECPIGYLWNGASCQLCPAWAPVDALTGACNLCAGGSCSVSKLRRFPPKAFESQSTTILTTFNGVPAYNTNITLTPDNILYGAGTYEVYFSSVWLNKINDATNMFSIFNGADTIGSPTAYFTENVYSKTTGIYEGTRYLVSSQLKGEWVAVKLPQNISIRRYTIVANNPGWGVERWPKSFLIHGSNNGNSWIMLDNVTSVSYTDFRYTKIINNSLTFQYLALTITENFIDSKGLVWFNRWILYDESGDSICANGTYAATPDSAACTECPKGTLSVSINLARTCGLTQNQNCLVTASSYTSHSPIQRANDGDFILAAARTLWDNEPWIRIDFETERQIRGGRIWSANGDRFSDIKIWIGSNGQAFNGVGNTNCFTMRDQVYAPLFDLNFTCVNQGRYLYVHKVYSTSTQFIVLFEIEVYPLLNTTACPGCAPGTFSGEVGANACIACSPNSMSPASSTTILNCTCNPGYTGSDGGTCTICAAGFYKGLQGSSPCLTCELGFYAATAGMSACLQCENGKYAGVIGASSCLSCTGSCSTSQYEDPPCNPVSNRACSSCPSGAARCTASQRITVEPYQGLINYSVPENVKSIQVKMWGGGGGSKQEGTSTTFWRNLNTGNGGAGGYAECVLSVNTGMVLRMSAGRGGDYGLRNEVSITNESGTYDLHNNPAKGGGKSELFSNNDRWMTVGGGGGGGAARYSHGAYCWISPTTDTSHGGSGGGNGAGTVCSGTSFSNYNGGTCTYTGRGQGVAGVSSGSCASGSAPVHDWWFFSSGGGDGCNAGSGSQGHSNTVVSCGGGGAGFIDTSVCSSMVATTQVQNTRTGLNSAKAPIGYSAPGQGGNKAGTSSTLRGNDGLVYLQYCTEDFVPFTNAVTGSISCLCKPGKFHVGTTCTNCSPGSYSSVNGASACIACPAGNYSNVEGLSACLNCPSGTSSVSGSSICRCSAAGTAPLLKMNPAFQSQNATLFADVPGYYVHQFKSVGLAPVTFAQDTIADVLVVGGGGGGGSDIGGGGGAGAVLYYSGYRFLANENYDVVVGEGGAAAPNLPGNNGDDSLIKGTRVLFQAKGGGGGGTMDHTSCASLISTGKSGGSGGGGSTCYSGAVAGDLAGGSYLSTNVLSMISGFSLGNVGGTGQMRNGIWKNANAGGGGGAFSPGNPSIGEVPGSGGNGVYKMGFSVHVQSLQNMFGSAYASVAKLESDGNFYVAGGGGGGGNSQSGNAGVAPGGKGGGGAGKDDFNVVNGENGKSNAGSGGGGGSTNGLGGTGGSGLILIRYSICQPCAAGSFSMSDRCEACSENQFSGPGSATCQSCPSLSVGNAPARDKCVARPGAFATYAQAGQYALTSQSVTLSSNQVFAFNNDLSSSVFWGLSNSVTLNLDFGYPIIAAVGGILVQPLAWYKFDQDNCLTDSSGNGYTLTFNAANSASLATCSSESMKRGTSAAKFVASLRNNFRIDPAVADVWALDTATASGGIGVTIAFWGLMTTSTQDAGRLFCFDTGNTAGVETIKYFMCKRDGTTNNIEFMRFTNPNTVRWVKSGLVDNFWHHYVWSVAGGGTWRIWIDGIQVVGTAAEGFATANQKSATIQPPDSGQKRFYNWGARETGNDRLLDGNIDDFRIYHGVLTDAQVSNLYGEGAGLGYHPSVAIASPQAGTAVADNDYPIVTDSQGQQVQPLVWYKFDSSGCTADSSGNGFTLTFSTANSGTIATCSTDSVKRGISSANFVSASKNNFRWTAAQAETLNLPQVQRDTGISIATWARILSTATNWARIYDFVVSSSDDGSSRIAGFILNKVSTTNDVCFWHSAGGAACKYTASGFVDGNWHHYVISIAANGGWTVWIDGIKQMCPTCGNTNTGNLDNKTSSQFYAYRFGSLNGGSSSYLDGNIDDFRIYKTVLTTAQVTTLYQGRAAVYNVSFQQCPSATYLSAQGATTCLTCPGNSSSASTNGAACVCNAGFYNSFDLGKTCGAQGNAYCTASQSHSGIAGAPLSNDGDLNTYGYVSVGTDKWWRIDLEYQRSIIGGVIWNRRDSNSVKLNGYKIWIGNNGATYNASGNINCFTATTTEHTVPPHYVSSFTCVGKAQYLYVHTNNGHFLHFSEIDIHSGSEPPTCVPCLEGMWCSNNFVNACPLNSNSPQSSVSITNCSCNPGYTGSNGGTCTACSRLGTYKSVQGSLPCLNCPPGNVSWADASTSCAACAAGSYNRLSQQQTCIQCPIGTFANTSGMSACLLCESGKYASAIGASSCLSCTGFCNATQFADPPCNPGSNLKCSNCPFGIGCRKAESVIVDSTLSWTVPTNVNSINVRLWGAGGGAKQHSRPYDGFWSYTGKGGAGGFAECTLSVLPSFVLRLSLGNAGVGGYYLPNIWNVMPTGGSKTELLWMSSSQIRWMTVGGGGGGGATRNTGGGDCWIRNFYDISGGSGGGGSQNGATCQGVWLSKNADINLPCSGYAGFNGTGVPGTTNELCSVPTAPNAPGGSAKGGDGCNSGDGRYSGLPNGALMSCGGGGAGFVNSAVCQSPDFATSPQDTRDAPRQNKLPFGLTYANAGNGGLNVGSHENWELLDGQRGLIYIQYCASNETAFVDAVTQTLACSPLSDGVTSISKLRRFPPKAYDSITSEISTTFSGVPAYNRNITLTQDNVLYGAGTYAIYYSCLWGGGNSLNMFSVFNFADNTANVGGHCQYPLYNTTTGIYYGTKYLADVNSKGEWIAIQVPNAIIMKRYTIVRRSANPLRAPLSFTIHGSNNGQTWTLLDNITSAVYSDNRFSSILNNNQAFSFFSVTVHQLPAGTDQILNFNQWILYDESGNSICTNGTYASDSAACAKCPKGTFTPSVNLAKTCGPLNNSFCTAAMSAQYGSHIAQYGNDGLFSTYFHTICSPEIMWWSLDFEYSRNFRGGRIWNRVDSPVRLNNYQIWIGNNQTIFNGIGNSRCFTSTSDMHYLPPDYDTNFTCIGQGRYLYVHIFSTGGYCLHFREIEVYPLLNATACAGCAPGYHEAFHGASACDICPVGSFSLASATACSQCTSCDHTTLSTCTSQGRGMDTECACNSSFYLGNPFGSRSKCLQCPPNTQSSALNSNLTSAACSCNPGFSCAYNQRVNVAFKLDLPLESFDSNIDMRLREALADASDACLEDVTLAQTSKFQNSKTEFLAFISGADTLLYPDFHFNPISTGAPSLISELQWKLDYDITVMAHS